MPVISALRQDERRPQRYHLDLDDGRVLTLDEALVAGERLTPGLALAEAAIERLRTAEEERALIERAARYLAARPRSRMETRRRLLRPAPGKPAPSAGAVERALARMEELGYLDDAAFAGYWAEQRDRFSPRSARAIQQELRLRGVDAETAAASALPDEDEERAVAAGRKRLRALASVDERDFALRMGGFLQRRGFGYGVTRSVIRRLWEEARAGERGQEGVLPDPLAALDDSERDASAGEPDGETW